MRTTSLGIASQDISSLGQAFIHGGHGLFWGWVWGDPLPPSPPIESPALARALGLLLQLSSIGFYCFIPSIS